MQTAIVLLLAVSLRAQDPGRGVNLYSYEKEKALGAQLAGEYRRTAGVIESPELQQRIEALGRSLVPADSHFQYTFQVSPSYDKELHEVVAFPGGYLFVPSGTILAARNIGELAGMMAHSIGHVEARHGTKMATKAELARQAAVPLIFLGGWSGYATRENAALTVPLNLRQMARTWERDADLLGAGYMTAAGYAPARLADAIGRMAPEAEERDARAAALRALAAPAAVPANAPDLGAMQELARRGAPDGEKAAPRLAR